MFDDLFKSESKSIKSTTEPIKKDTTKSGMFSSVFGEEKPLVTPQVVSPVSTPVVTEPKKKNTFLNAVKSMFFLTGTKGFISKPVQESIDKSVIKPTLDTIVNTPTGKEIITTTEKATRGSSIFKAVPSATVEYLSDKIAGIKSGKDIVDYYGESVNEWEKGGQDPTMSFTNKIARSVLDSGVQSSIGVLLNLIPVVGKASSMTYYSALSASEQINERGEVNSLGNIGIDVAGDMILGNMIEGLFKKPATELVKTGFKETTKRLLTGAGKGFIVEGTTEPAQTFLKYANDFKNAKTPEERSNVIEQTKEYVKGGGMLLEFLVGGISGAGITSLATMANESRINPNIPKPRLGLTEDKDKEFTKEQNKVRESFREDIKQDLADTGMNKPYVARQISNETGIDNSITTLMVDEIADTIEKKTSKIDLEEISKQALQEAGMVQEEIKTPEVPTEQPKLKISKEEPLITEAKKYPTKEEFINSIIHDKGGVGNGVEYAPYKRLVETNLNNKPITDFGIKPDEKITIYRGVDNASQKSIQEGDYIALSYDLAKSYTGGKVISKEVPASSIRVASSDGLTAKDFSNRNKMHIEAVYNPKKLIKQSQLEEIYKQAHGESKLKIKIESTKKLQSKIDDEIAGNIDALLEEANTLHKGKLRLDEISDLEDIQEKVIKGKLTQDDRLTYNEIAKKLGREDLLPKGLDINKTKEDNKEYESKRSTNNRTEINEGIQSNGERVRRINDDKVSYKLEKESRGNSLSSDKQGKNGGRNETPYRYLPNGKTGAEIKEIITDYLPQAKPPAINKLVSYYTRLDNAGYILILDRKDTYSGRTDFDAFIEYTNKDEYTLNLNNKDVNILSQETLDHEIGTHIYYPNTLNSRRIELFNGAKEVYNTKPELFDNFSDYFQREYWDMFILRHLRYQIRNANKTITNTEEVNQILRDTGFLNENDEIIYPENIMDTTFNFNKLNEKLNKYLVDNGYNISSQTEEQNNMMGEEIIAYIAQEAKAFSKSGNEVIEDYSNDLLNDTLDFSKPEVNLPFGGQVIKLKLKDSTKLTSADIIKKHANIQLKRDIVITDVYGEKATLKAGEGITPYEMKGNKFILQDGEAYLVSKSQAQNVINNSKTGEAKPFAPELKQTEETVKGTRKNINKLKKEESILDKENIKLMKEMVSYGDVSKIPQSLKDKISINEEKLRIKRKEIENLSNSNSENTKYSQYTLPGGENYKEILIKAPTQEQVYSRNDIKEVVENQYGEWEVKLKDGTKFVYPDVATETEAKNQFQKDLDRGRISIKEKIVNKGIFKSSHWDEPNVISHIRMNERTYNGKKVAFMEELQSDWAREYRNSQTKGDSFRINTVSDNEFEVIRNGDDELMATVSTEKEAEDFIKENSGGNESKIPSNPLLKNWQELSIKRALQEAVNTNAKYFAWINGPQTAARYNLSKEIDNINWNQSQIGGKTITLSPKTGSKIGITTDKDGLIIGSSETTFKGKKLDEVIGKGIAEKIMASPEGKLEGEGLNMGGEWATNLYDRQVRTIVENLTGQKVEMLDMGLPVEKSDKTWSILDSRGIVGEGLTPKDLKVGSSVTTHPFGMATPTDSYVITDVLSNGKFVVVEKGFYDSMKARWLDMEKDPNWQSHIPESSKKTFSISDKKTLQMGIELTPEVKQIVKGEAPQVKVSGKLPFTEQITAPVMFKLKMSEDPIINEARKYKTVEEFISTNPIKDSVVKDRVFHGSPVGFDASEFNLDNFGTQGFTEGKGFYFTDDKSVASGYARGTGKLFDVYLDIKKPLDLEQRKITDTQIKKVLEKLLKNNPEALSNYGDVEYEGKNKVMNYAVELLSSNESDIDLIQDVGNSGIAGALEVNKTFKEVTGYDGVVTKWPQGTNIYVAFTPEQIMEVKDLEEIWNRANQTAPAMFKIKLPDVNTGNKLEDAKQILAHVENKLGVSSIVNSIKEKELAVEIAKEVLDLSPMKELEPYVADAGDFKGTLPEVTGKSIEELKKNKAFRGVKNEKAIKFANSGDEIAQEITSEYGMDMDSNEVRAEFENYKDEKEKIVKQEKELKQQKDLFKTTDTFKLAGIDKTLIGEITQTREMPQTIMEIMDQVKKEKKARREEVLNHPARPLMKYIDKKTQKLPKIGSKTAFGKEGEQILKDLKFDDVTEANKALADYISKRNEFVNPISRLALEERNAKFLRDKQKILEEVEKKIRAEARDRKSKIEAVRDFFYMTDGEVRDVIGDKDYRLLTETQFEEMLKDLEAKSIEIAQHAVAVSELEWTIAQKELHRVENMQEVLGYPKDVNKMTTEQLNNLNQVLGKFQTGDVFLGVREMETLAKNAGLPDVKTQRQILEEVLGKRTGLPIEKLREIVVGSFDDLRSAISLARQNAFYEVLVSDFYQLKIEAGLRYREIEQKTNELVKKARASRPQSWKQKIAPTDDMVIAYLEEGDLDTKAKIAKTMTKAELELAHYVKERYAEMRDFLIARQQLEKERQNYYTHRPRGFFEAWLRNEVIKTPTQFIRAFGNAFKETFIDVNKMDDATFKILNEQTEEILPLEKFFKYSMRRSGQLIPTKNLANAFLGYTRTFELKKGLDQYMPRMEAVARALTPTETTEGGVVKDTSLEKFVKKWINTQKGRPVTVGPIQPGGVLDGLLRGGVAFTRFLDLALRIPAQVMSLVGEESATWINIGTKKYLLGEYRAKTAQGKKIAKKYESFVGTTFWDKMKEESMGIPSKLGETLFAFYGIASRNSNIHHLLGVLTQEEFKSGEIKPARLTQIKMEMNRWRADDLLHSVMGKTSVGAVFREHKSWAIPIVNQVLSNIKTLSKMVNSGEYKQASKSKEFGELFRATMLTLILVLSISRIYKDLKDKKDRSFTEELEYRAMNDAFSFLSALSPSTLFSVPRLAGWLTDLAKAVTSFSGAIATGERTATGEIPGLKIIKQSVTPKLLKPLFTPTEEDKVNTSISTSTIKAQKELDIIKSEIVEPAQIAWEEVKKLGVGTEEADALVDELSDDEYEAYKLVKKADIEYWTDVSEKVTPIVKQAFKLEFGTPEADALVEKLSDDEYAMYKTVKSNLYGKGEATAQPTDWDKQSFLTHVVNMAKGWTTDPITAFDNLIHGDWKITKVKGGAIIVDRMPLDASQKMKEEVAKNNENYKLDHVIPLTASGTNRKLNLNIITTEEWEENTPVEVYLGKQLEEGNITAKQAKEYIIRFKGGRGQLDGTKMYEVYQDKYNGQPLTFDEIKQDIVK